MEIRNPRTSEVHQLWTLWREAFGDDGWVHLFESFAFSKDRCLCAFEGERVLSMLFWFDYTMDDQKVAYLYGIATKKEMQGKGICHALMRYAHSHLKSLKYQSAILVPSSEPLFPFYKKMGYQIATYADIVTCTPSGDTIDLCEIAQKKYAEMRKEYLTSNSVIESDEALRLVAATDKFYAANDCLFCGRIENGQYITTEFFGNKSRCKEIVNHFQCKQGRFRIHDRKTPFSLYLPLTNKQSAVPSYLGIAFEI